MYWLGFIIPLVITFLLSLWLSKNVKNSTVEFPMKFKLF